MQVGKISLVFCFFHFVICFFARQTDRWIVHLSSLICDFCPSDQEFAYSFLQILPYDRHPCCSAIHFLVA